MAKYLLAIFIFHFMKARLLTLFYNENCQVKKKKQIRMKSFALNPAFIMRFKTTRKGPIERQTTTNI